MYKIIASDLDETLLNKKTRMVGERNLEAIRRASEMGVKFVPASGRGYATIQGTLEELGLRDKENEYIISFNGGAITENKNNRRLFFKGITYEKMKMIFDAGQSYDVCTHIYTDDTVYIYNINEGEEKFLWHRMDYVPIKKEEIQMLADKPLAKILFQNTDVRYLEKIAKDLERLLKIWNRSPATRSSAIRRTAISSSISRESIRARDFSAWLRSSEWTQKIRLQSVTTTMISQ